MWFESSKYFPCLLHTLIVLFRGGLLIVCNKFVKQFAINYAVIFIAVTHFRGQKLTFPMPQREKGQGVSITTQAHILVPSAHTEDNMYLLKSSFNLFTNKGTYSVGHCECCWAGFRWATETETYRVSSEMFAGQGTLLIWDLLVLLSFGRVFLFGMLFFFIHSLTKSNILRGNAPISTVLHFPTTTETLH